MVYYNIKFKDGSESLMHYGVAGKSGRYKQGSQNNAGNKHRYVYINGKGYLIDDVTKQGSREVQGNARSVDKKGELKGNVFTRTYDDVVGNTKQYVINPDDQTGVIVNPKTKSFDLIDTRWDTMTKEEYKDVRKDTFSDFKKPPKGIGDLISKMQSTTIRMSRKIAAFGRDIIRNGLKDNYVVK